LALAFAEVAAMNFKIVDENLANRNVRSRVEHSRNRAIAKSIRARTLAEAEGYRPHPICRWHHPSRRIHWYEAAGIGSKEFKIKNLL
jgi:hypothetical protein